MTESLAVVAPAKVNLVLRVRGRRPDGFHDIETVFQAIGLFDDVEVRMGPAGQSAGPAVTLEVIGADLGPPRDNLAHRAAVAFLEAARLDRAVALRVRKRIPAGAGLGGGSSDAAAVLRCLAVLTGRGDVPLARLGATLGSDVAFFLGSSPLARATGRGEVLTPLAPLPERWLVVATPPVHVSTAEAYGALAASRAPAASRPETVGGGRPTPEVQAPVSWSEVAASAANDFEDVVAARHEEIRASLAGLRQAAGDPVLLSGSGAASFGVFADADEAADVADRLTRRHGWPFVAAPSLGVLPEPRRG